MHFLGPPNIFSFHVLNLYGGHLYRLNISKTINLLFTSNLHSLHTCATLLGELFEFQAILELDLLTKYRGCCIDRELFKQRELFKHWEL